MPQIRVLYCSNAPELAKSEEALRERARVVRSEPGCLEFDFFRDVEYPENFAQLELWESAPAFDTHWLTVGSRSVFVDVASLCAPYHRGAPESPRRDGNNGAEFYPLQRFEMDGRIFIPANPQDRLTSLRWPSRSGVRIIIQSSTDPASDESFYAYSAETRQQRGCVEFAFFRSLEFPENNLHLELWSGPPVVYDEHYYLRTIQSLYGMGLPRPPSTRVERRYGTAGFEFYQHTFYALLGSMWEPESAAERLTTIHWP